MTKAEEYLKTNDYVPNEHGAYIYQNKQGGQHCINMEAILLDFADQDSLINDKIKEDLEIRIDILKDIRNILKLEPGESVTMAVSKLKEGVASLRKELDQKERDVQDQLSKFEEAVRKLAEEISLEISLGLNKELEEEKRISEGYKTNHDALLKGFIEERAKSAKLVEALQGAKNYIIYVKDEFKLSDAGQTLSEINERLGEYEGKGGGNG